VKNNLARSRTFTTLSFRMSLIDPLPINPFTRPAKGTVVLPGSKSITNRALILGALGRETVTLQGALFSRDSYLMVAALRALGFTVETDESSATITISGRDGVIPKREA
jgi:3-phosphoshikimate 1-carboxyvinyltransferase